MASLETASQAPLQLWPIFICYRRADGMDVARRLHELLDKWRETAPDGIHIEIDAYLDETMPGVADWRELHRPYLERARAMVVVCTPGAKIHEGPDDWVHKEIEWWLEHRATAPILIDALNEGIRYVPSSIAEKWPEIQRIALVEKEWIGLSEPARAAKAEAVRRHVIGAILPSGAAIYAQELEAERERVRQLEISQAQAEAAHLDARAAGLFTQARLVETRRALETARRIDLAARLESERQNAADQAAESTRIRNLCNELEQLERDIGGLRSATRELRDEGLEVLVDADTAWGRVTSVSDEPPARSRPKPPRVFSVEVLDAGHGECLLIHYGPLGDVRHVLVNCGPRSRYDKSLEPRLREIAGARLAGGPAPIELLVISDRDEEKTGGLVKLLDAVAAADDLDARPAEIRRLWANLFRTENVKGLRPRIVSRIDELEVPWNEPFDRFVARPDQGRAVVKLAGGMEIVVLGPAREWLARLHKDVARHAHDHDGTIEDLLEESFAGVELEETGDPLSAPPSADLPDDDCRPSENARRLAGGAYKDESLANLASTILLFRFGGLTFLHTGDARGDLVLRGLDAAGLLDPDGRAHVDLISIPHFGSQRSVAPDFFERVRADSYLFSGDGRHGNPEVATVAALITARGCERYQMVFVNRDGKTDEHGRRLDEFFERERPFHPNYRRIFRSDERGSVILDLLDPVRR